MPTETCYEKSISGNFPNQKVNTSSLTKEINSSAISISILRIDTNGDTCMIWFRDVLSSENQTILGNIVSNHSGKDETFFETFKLVEEDVPTGGHFNTLSINIMAEANSWNVQNVSWPHPVTALAMKLTTDEIVSRDKIDMKVGGDTIVGILSANSGNNPSTWASGNYVVGDKVLYTLPILGERPYTCINNTTASQIPTNKNYWQLGYQLFPSATVMRYSQIGFYMSLTDGVNTQDVGRIIYKNLTSIFVEIAPTNNFLAASPTYIKQTVYVLKDHYIGNGRNFSIGDGKLGGSYIPTDTIVNIKYTNNSASTKYLSGFVEFLY